MNGAGSGGRPSAWRSTAQWIVSAPRMLAAALEISRLVNTGIRGDIGQRRAPMLEFRRRRI